MSRKQLVAQPRVIDNFVGRVLDAYKAGTISRLDAIEAVGHVWTAIDQGNETEFTTFPLNWGAPKS
ncbi:hypothetical protein [Cupriavidus taiwanensis]|uniref:hypothetical protein n=1 Tax=Cupriavidus taiwanensis TaxID=164546 RepID=UPI0011C06CD7|nr:hypothetical protein [Cupriavidus taiwanensis]